MSNNFWYGDIEKAAEKRTGLIDKEKELRDRVGGDLLDPRYAQGLNDILNTTMTDPFYAKAALTKQFFTQSIAGKQDYVMKTGQYPEDWQDPMSQIIAGYKNAEETPFNKPDVIKPFVDIDPRLMSMLEPTLQGLFEKGEYKIETDEKTGLVTLTNRQNETVSLDYLLDILDFSNVEANPEYKQLKEMFENDEALKAQHKNFETYWKRVKKSVAMRFVKNKERENTTVIRDPEDATARARATAKTSKDVGDEFDYKIRMGPSGQVYGAASPVGSPTRKLNDTAEELVEFQLKEF
jgi:hypothetical protein